jgi:hypothetical protein
MDGTLARNHQRVKAIFISLSRKKSGGGTPATSPNNGGVLCGDALTACFLAACTVPAPHPIRFPVWDPNWDGDEAIPLAMARPPPDRLAWLPAWRLTAWMPAQQSGCTEGLMATSPRPSGVKMPLKYLPPLGKCTPGSYMERCFAHLRTRYATMLQCWIQRI